MPALRKPDTPERQRDRAYYERRKAGLVVVPVTVHQSRRAEIEAIAAQMQEPAAPDDQVPR